MYNFCTIITANFLNYALVERDLIAKINNNFILSVLVVDAPKQNMPQQLNIEFFDIDDLREIEYASVIYKKYSSQRFDVLRWALKPVFVNFLLRKDYEKLIFIDPDIAFFGDYRFLFEILEEHRFFVVPHFRPNDPFIDEHRFIALYREGLYNAGIFGANKQAQDILSWWSKLCYYKCEKDFCLGFYDDQKYLDAVTVYFDNVYVLKHKGVDISLWNCLYYNFSQDRDKVLIDAKYPVVCIHLTNDTIYYFLKNPQHLLHSFVKIYLEELKKYGDDLETNMLQYYRQKEYEQLPLKIKIRIKLSKIKKTFQKWLKK